MSKYQELKNNQEMNNYNKSYFLAGEPEYIKYKNEYGRIIKINMSDLKKNSSIRVNIRSVYIFNIKFRLYDHLMSHEYLTGEMRNYGIIFLIDDDDEKIGFASITDNDIVDYLFYDNIFQQLKVNSEYMEQMIGGTKDAYNEYINDRDSFFCRRGYNSDSNSDCDSDSDSDLSDNEIIKKEKIRQENESKEQDNEVELIRKQFYQSNLTLSDIESDEEI